MGGGGSKRVTWVAWRAISPLQLSMGVSVSGWTPLSIWVAWSGWWASPGDSRPVGACGGEPAPPGAHVVICRRGPASLQYPHREHPGRGAAGGGVLQDEECESRTHPAPPQALVCSWTYEAESPPCPSGQPGPMGFLPKSALGGGCGALHPDGPPTGPPLLTIRTLANSLGTPTLPLLP